MNKTSDNCVISKADLWAIGVGNVLSTSETARFSKVEVLETRLKTLICLKMTQTMKGLDTGESRSAGTA